MWIPGEIIPLYLAYEGSKRPKAKNVFTADA